MVSDSQHFDRIHLMCERLGSLYKDRKVKFCPVAQSGKFKLGWVDNHEMRIRYQREADTFDALYGDFVLLTRYLDDIIEKEATPTEPTCECAAPAPPPMIAKVKIIGRSAKKGYDGVDEDIPKGFVRVEYGPEGQFMYVRADKTSHFRPLGTK